MQDQTDFDVIIIGGGLSGLTLALCLASRGVKTACIDRDNPVTQATLAFDGRTVAISAGSAAILEDAGIWDDLLPQACPITDIQITDGGLPTLLDFGADEVNSKSFGHIIENRHLRKALFTAAKSAKNLTHIAPAQVDAFEVDDNAVSVRLATGKTMSAKLLVGADGKNSWVREQAGIRTRGWQYHQRAIICVVTHEHPHHNCAVEDFRPEGPFAILPMVDNDKGQHCSSIVWTEHGPKNRSALNFDEEMFNLALSVYFPDSYGEVKQLTKAQAYPLGLTHAARYTAPRIALIADAAHAIHPIAGQGLNIGLRDVQELVALVSTAEDPGHPDVLDAYERARRIDNMAMIFATDTLNKLFSNNIPPVRFLRRLGLKAVGKIPAAKRFFMKQAMGLR